MKKFIIPATIALVIIVVAGGAYYYYHNFIEVVTSYYRFTYEPPHERPSFIGKSYSDPKIEIAQVQYASDSIALVKEKEYAKGRYEGYAKSLEEEAKKPMPKDEKGRMEHLMKPKVLAELMEKQYNLIIITHTRDYNTDEVINLIKAKGLNSRDIEEYQRRHKVSVRIEDTSFLHI